MPITFLVRQTLSCITLAILLIGYGAIPAGARNADHFVTTDANKGKDREGSAVKSSPALSLTHKAGKAALEIRFPHSKVQILPLKTDASVNPQTANATVELVASVSNKTLIIQDTHASRPGPLSMCQAGQESFLRVIRLAPLGEILSLKLASCRDDIELASPGLEWHADTATLKIRWLSVVNRTAQEKTLHIGSDGTIILSPQ
jgi:hypothetical protein